MKSSEAAKPTKAKLKIVFFFAFEIEEKRVAAIAEINPTERVVSSPPSVVKSNTTINAPKEAPIKSAKYNLPDIAAKALKAADMIIPTQKNGIAKRNMNSGIYVMCEDRICIVNNAIGVEIVMPIAEKMVKSLAQFSLIFLNLC